MQRRLGFTSVVCDARSQKRIHRGRLVCLLDRGRIRFMGSAEEVRGTRDELMREFLKAAF
jgi:hypothetical protein